jgi:hypothetical protein
LIFSKPINFHGKIWNRLYGHSVCGRKHQKKSSPEDRKLMINMFKSLKFTFGYIAAKRKEGKSVKRQLPTPFRSRRSALGNTSLKVHSN